jgi:manganese-dependent ADP-ribose/CDP-alcohol diphosphatase
MRRITGLMCLVLAGAAVAAAPARQQKPILTFGVIADVQYRDADPVGTRFYRDSIGKLEEAVARLNDRHPTFTIQLGDLIDGRFASFDTILPIFDRLSMRRYHVLGNHDVSLEAENQPKLLGRLGLDRLGDGKGYYDFRRSSWRFIVLNGNDLSVLGYPAGSPAWTASEQMMAALKKTGAMNAEIYNGGLGPAQIAWLKRTLAAASASRERVIVFGHFPLFPPNPATLWNDAEVMQILESCPGVVAYFCGHKHEGDYALKNAVHYVNIHGMVEGKDTAWALVDVFRDSLHITGFGREPSRVLELRPLAPR